MSKLMTFEKTPAAMGYSFPPEWAKHEATWLSWPRPEGVSFPNRYALVPENLARIISAIAAREKVHINVPDAKWEREVRSSLREFRCPLKNVRFFHIRTNEPWCRDHGPSFVRRSSARGGKKLAIVNWGFNAWGGKYPPWDDDDLVPDRVAEALGLAMFEPGVIMEGGSVDFNGAGTILTTTDCLLNKNRNPTLSKKGIERALKDYYGQMHVVWLTGGIVGDDTDGHVDDLARFISPRKIVIGVEEDRKDVNYQVLRDARKQLNRLRDQDGRPFEIVEIPMPAAVVNKHQRLPATYVNFYFVNGALLVPTYRDRVNDRRAIEILQSHLPRRKVIGVDCTEVIWGLGAIHCLTQQQPAV